MRRGIVFIFVLTLSLKGFSQVNEHETGAWYMYFWNTTVKKSQFGFQGDVQLRKWNIFGDLEQLLIRGGLTYSPRNANVKFTLGYGDVTSGTYGESKETTRESRIYQEVLIPNTIGNRFYLKHRFRYEQRFVEEQLFRTRYRYALFLNIPMNKPKLEEGALYLALYDEIFINGQRDIGGGSTVEIFDRNRLYLGLGYGITDNLSIQAGFMQQATNSWCKGQLQLSLNHTIQFKRANGKPTN